MELPHTQMGGIPHNHMFDFTNIQYKIPKANSKKLFIHMKILEMECINHFPPNKRNKIENTKVEILKTQNISRILSKTRPSICSAYHLMKT